MKTSEQYKYFVKELELVHLDSMVKMLAATIRLTRKLGVVDGEDEVTHNDGLLDYFQEARRRCLQHRWDMLGGETKPEGDSDE